MLPPSVFVERSLTAAIRRAFQEFPVVLVTDPRQSGKTTLLQHVYPEFQYAALDAPDLRAAFAADPRAMLARFPSPAIFDEVQNAPELLPYIKAQVDQRRHLAGQYLLTGSQNLLLMARVSETLAGRAAVLRLQPFTHRERASKPHALLPWEADPNQTIETAPRKPAQQNLWNRILRGAYPEIAVDIRRDATLWHRSYMQTYLERDVRTLRQIGDLTQFQEFLRLLAARSGQLLNLSSFSRDLGIAVNTVKAWLSALEASFQIIIVRPYHSNIGKRLIKTPKVYFTDTGMVCFLTGLRDPQHAAQGPLGGALFKTAVLAEVAHSLWHRGEEPRIHFWRTPAGAEVDFLVEHNGQLVPLVVKLSSTPRPRMATNIGRLVRDFDRASKAGARSLRQTATLRPGYVIHPGDANWPLGWNVSALPFRALWE